MLADPKSDALIDRRRGGLLGQASVLTLTANGIDTSPVVRGVWLLENLLGTPPSPPPPDVEPLDPVGGWRATYTKGAKIDASGELPGGKTFEDNVGLKDVLLDQTDLFAASVVKKLMAYGMGRHVEPTDWPHVDAILAATANEYRLQDLIVQVVLSEPFRTP